jgi:hypothetical protein
MKESLHRHWKRTPDRIRRPLVLIVGISIVLLSGAVGWLPGPGGIPIFLLGVAILASEFHWAHRFKVFILENVYKSGKWMRANKMLAFLLLCLGLGTSIYITYTLIHLR